MVFVAVRAVITLCILAIATSFVFAAAFSATTSAVATVSMLRVVGKLPVFVDGLPVFVTSVFASATVMSAITVFCHSCITFVDCMVFALSNHLDLIDVSDMNDVSDGNHRAVSCLGRFYRHHAVQ